MKSADEYYEELDSVDEFSLLRLINEVQIDCYNSSLKDVVRLIIVDDSIQDRLSIIGKIEKLTKP